MDEFEKEFNKKIKNFCSELAELLQWANTEISQVIASSFDQNNSTDLFGSIEVSCKAKGIKFSFEKGTLKLQHSVNSEAKVSKYTDEIIIDDTVKQIIEKNLDSEIKIH